MSGKRKAITKAAISAGNRPPVQSLDPLTVEPDDLRNAVRRSLAMLPEADRPARQCLLLASLEYAGVNMGSALLMLGIPAGRADELTPLDMGKLLRYVRINQPEAITAIAELLTQLLCAASGEPAVTVQKARKAA